MKNGPHLGDTGTVAAPASRSGRGWAYLLAVVITLTTLGGRLAFAAWFEGRPALVLFVLPIFLSAYVGGLGPGLVSTTIFALGSAYYLLPPIHSFAVDGSVDTVLWLALILIGVLISVLTESLHAGRRIRVESVASGKSAAMQRKVQGGFALALAFLVVIGAVSVLSVSRMRTDTGWANHTEKVIASLRLLLSAVTDAETAERGYLITGEENYLEPQAKARRTIAEEQQLLRKLTADNAEQQRQLDRLGPLIVERLTRADQSVALNRKQDLVSPEAVRSISEGKRLHDRIRELIAEMEATEQGLLRVREDRAQQGSQLTRTVIIGGGTLAFVCMLVALFVMNQEFAIRQRTEEELRLARDELEARVRARTAELEQTNTALQASEELFSRAFRLSPDLIAIIRLADRTVIRANEAICRLWGSTPEAIIGKPTQEYTNWLSEEERLAFMQKLQAEGENLNHETTLRLTDGRLVQFNVSSRLITLGGETCILSVLQDITDRKAAEITTARLAAIVEFSEDAIIGKDLDGTITSWNNGAERIFGYAAREIVGQPITRLIPPDRLVEEAGILARLRQGKNVPSFETVRLHKRGAAIAVSVTASVIRDANGRVIGASKIVRDISEAKRAEMALQQTQTRLKSTLAAGSIGTWTWDIVNDRLTADEFTARIFSIDPVAATQGLPAVAYLQAVLEADQLGVSAALTRAIESGGLYDLEYRVHQKDGEVRWLQARGRVEHDAAGHAANFHGSVVDITQRKQAEAAIRESEEYFRFLNDLAEATRPLADPAEIMAVTARMLGVHLHASRCAYADVEPDGEQFIILHDYTDGCGSTVGRYQLSFFGSRAVATLHRGETLVLRDVAVELPPGEGAEMFAAIGIKAIITCPLLKDGVLRAMMAVHQTVPREWKLREVSIVQEVVERCWSTISRRTAEEKVRLLNVELEQRVVERTAELADLYNNAPCGYHSLDPAGRFIGINETELAWLGYTREEIVGVMNATHLLTPASVVVFQENYPRFKESGRLDNLELEMVRKDGSILPVLLSATRVADESGRFMRSRSTIVDYTDRKRAETELRVSQVQLEAANKELEAFSYSVSHDLRAPLRAVDGFSQAVMEDYGPQLPPEGQRQLQTIRDSAQRMGELIDDLLAFARLSRQPLARRTVETGKLVREVLGEMSAQQQGRQIDLRVGELPDCDGDRALLKQVWINLIANALKYTRRRTRAVVEIGCEAGPDGGVYFIRDNGTGFDMQYAGKLFGVFQRLHRQEDYEGTGVGLAIVQRIIHRHGGRVWAEAAVDRGATFYFTLNPKA